VEWIRKSVVQGKTMGSELNSKKFKEFPIVAARMIAIGEKTGKLDEILLYLADFYEEEVDDTIKNLAGILEPIMLLAIGFVVAFIGLAIISPIYELTGSIKR
jgi:type II secretory pathway component PulF